ncbi:MAG: diguanylate cyclase (GGDEF)-like protein [Oleiphilaceae bacterium]|jgi:diguanylate cyclase (GGDEF)-like protein
MPSVDELIMTARKNEVIARNLFDIEVAIMNITRCSEFFISLVSLVKEKFAIDHVWLVLTESPSNEHLIETLEEVDEDKDFLLRVSMVDFLRATESIHEPILANAGLNRYRGIIPAEVRKKLGSIAILPIVVDSKVVGALVLGDETAGRYNPRKDSFFLKQLSVKVSFSLAGVWARERISFLATRDPLTLLRNRRELEESLEQELSRHMRQRENMAVMFIDCDDFKIVNDTYGHDCGDSYLKHVAFHLNELTRKSDLAFRFAGDEFVVILPNQQQEGADVIASRIREHLLNTPLKIDDKTIPVVISYGVISTESIKKVNSKIMLKMADDRLYEMKRQKPSRSA